MKRLILSIGVLLTIVSCKPTTNNTINEKVISGLISEDTHWYSDTIYEIAGRVVVSDGVELTIDAGTTIKARDGQGSLSSALIVARGGMINAVGTSDNPIVFTSIYDEGQLDESDKGLWGGVVILGNAPISADATEALIEGLPANEEWGTYGGMNPHDNSGKLQFVSIRHGGTLLGDGNELNGLTLGGVGDGTTISDVEVVANLDDGIEFFGGTVDCQNLLVWAQGDDAFDIDQSYDGTITNYLAICDSDSDHALEIDGGEGTMNNPFRMEVGTLIDMTGVEVHIRDGATGYIEFYGEANVVQDSGTSVQVVNLTEGVDVSLFDWTWTKEKGGF
jgi:hypothetical protein